MTWIEITFFVLLAASFIFGFVMDVSMDGPLVSIFLPLIFALLFGVIPYAVVNDNTKTTFVKEEPLEILQKVTIGGELIVITDQADRIVFTTYKDVSSINGGAQLVKRYYKKDVYYGPDSEWSNVEVK